MRSLTFILGLTCLACVVAQENVASFSKGIERFAIDFYKQLAKDEVNKNMVSSPLSAYFALSMVAAGAGGNTANEMYQALHLPADKVAVHHGFDSLLKNLNNARRATIEIANKIYVANSFEVKADFSQLTHDVFSSEISNINMYRAEDAMNTINHWVDEKTHHKIHKIIDEEEIDPNSAMFLLNSLYFNALWASPFNESDTKNEKFYVDENTVKEVPTMNVIETFITKQVPELDAECFQIPFMDFDMNMYILFPKKINGLKYILENLHLFDISIFNDYDIYDVQNLSIFLPKFKIESSYDLNKYLEQLGMKDMFNTNANFTGITNGPLEITKVTQKIVIDVNELGVEAAASTAAAGGLRSIPGPMRFDHPFLYIIEKNGIFLFIGSLVDPTEN